MSDLDQRPPLSFKEERVIFFAQLGLAFARWAEIDALLVRLAGLAGVPTSPGNSASTLQALNIAMEKHFSTRAEYGVWQDVGRRTAALLQVKDQMTQGRLVQVSGNAPGGRIGFAPHDGGGGGATFFIRDIAQKRFECEALHNDLLTVHIRLFAAPVTQADYIPTAPAAPSIDVLREEIAIRFRQKPGEREKILGSSYDVGVAPGRIRG